MFLPSQTPAAVSERVSGATSAQPATPVLPVSGGANASVDLGGSAHAHASSADGHAVASTGAAIPDLPPVAAPAGVGGVPASPATQAPSVVAVGDGAHTITGSADGSTLYGIADDTMVGGGSSQTFVFTPGFGQDEIVDFIAGGPGHDLLDLSATPFHHLAQVLRHTSMADGFATIHLNAKDSITLDGVTKAQLKAHPHDFIFG